MSKQAISVTQVLVVALMVIIVASTGFLYYSNKITTTLTDTQTMTLTTIANYPTNDTSASLNPVWIYATASPSIVTIEGTASVNVGGFQNATEQVLGSGFVVLYQNSTYVVTNFHVVDSVTGMTVTFSDGDAYPGKVVGTDPYADLAIVSMQAPASEFHPIGVASSSTLKVGQPVAAIGNPYGLSGSMTIGIISQLGRSLQEPAAGNFSIADVIQFSAPINPGNSGGALLNAQGMVVGITAAVVGGSQGVGFAIPSDTILREIGPLIKNGSYDLHPFMGISAVDMNYHLAQAIGTNVTYGVLLESVASGGPAKKAGLVGGNKQVVIEGQPYLIGGDIIVSLNGTRIINYDALATYTEANALPGQTLEVGIIRSGNYMVVPLVLAERPPPPSS